MPLILAAFGGVYHVLTCACHRYSYATLLLVDYRLSFFYYRTIFLFFNTFLFLP